MAYLNCGRCGLEIKIQAACLGDPREPGEPFTDDGDEAW
jgi:hypothetical protein